MDLHRAVINLVVALQHLSPTQIARILHLLMFDTDQFHLSQVSQLVQHASPTQFRYLVAASVSLAPAPIAADEHAQQMEFLGQLSSVQFTSFGIVFQLCRLQEIFHQHFNGSCDQLFKVLEVIPNATPDKQLELLQMLQLLLIDVTPNNMIELQEETQHNNTSVALLLNIQPHNPMALVCEPMRSLLTVPQVDLLAIQRALIVLDPYQLALLVQLKQIDPFEIMELSQLLSPNHRIGALGLQVDSIDEEITLSLRIIDQPPEKSVYKRNLKPNPTVHVAGRPTQLEPEDQLYLVPKLVRCDTQVEVPDRLSGDTPIEVVAGSITAFRRIKVLITSHQMDETLFAIRFELQRYKRGEFCDVLCFVQSNPMAIVSHSTLMKTPTPLAPVIFEICPSYGNFHGETRVAIIGQNFVESPTARVKVAESYIVEPRFHDTGTLICTIPKHICSGEVEIRVSNDSTRWSETSTKFVYIDPAVNSF